jgi:hypothetical protein
MNREHDLDRLIDDAARQMARHEPSAALSGAVMARVSARATPFTHARVVWGSAVAGLAMAALVMTMVSGSRLWTPGAGPRTADAVLRASDALPLSEVARPPAGPKAGAQSPKPEAQSPKPTAQSPKPGVVPVVEMAAAPIDDPIVFESITAAPIAVEHLEVTALPTVDSIEIAPIDIEPISAND